jgi:hypothetical protein
VRGETGGDGDNEDCLKRTSLRKEERRNGGTEETLGFPRSKKIKRVLRFSVPPFLRVEGGRT